MRKPVASIELAARVITGETSAIARLLTRAESGTDEVKPAMDLIHRHAGRAHLVGITGVPGSGKSTLVAQLAAAFRQTGRTVGIIAIDPSSPYSGGSILGDRIRMAALSSDDGVFIRSAATRGAMGGLARGTLDAADILDAAGFDVIVIETVGVGQDEVDVVRASHTTVVVSAPGLGDDIQAVKAGVLEIADIHVVSKSDRPDAARTVSDLQQMLTLGEVRSRTAGWMVPVLATSSLQGDGISQLMQAIDQHHQALHESGELNARCRQIAERRMLKAAEEIVREDFARHREGKVAVMTDQVLSRQLTPERAAHELLRLTRQATDK